MTATRIRVDFNSRAKGGLVRSSMRRADMPVGSGDMVIAYQPGEDMEHFGRVVDVDLVSGRLTIDVDWDSKPATTTVKTVRGGSTKFVIRESSPYRLSPVVSGAALNSNRLHSPQLAGVH